MWINTCPSCFLLSFSNFLVLKYLGNLQFLFLVYFLSLYSTLSASTSLLHSIMCQHPWMSDGFPWPLAIKASGSPTPVSILSTFCLFIVEELLHLLFQASPFIWSMDPISFCFLRGYWSIDYVPSPCSFNVSSLLLTLSGLNILKSFPS